VSVSHHHHDYPAADIAAPAGTPVYALLDGTVIDAWSTPDPKCGIGMTFRTSDGQTWTYCHLAYLEPTIVTGATLAAGAPVGLVGETGDATGPHLHLQLDPQTVYPQSESWFQALAGRAFRWQDEPTPQASAQSITTGDVAVATGTATASNPGKPSSPAPTFEAGVDHPVFSVVPNAPISAASPVVTFTR
jgi:murein DD-endopeptidase MepM/ murein hydrolase activator NlpD